MISIRVSQEEYEFLKSVYESRGIRSVSEFARDAMNRILCNHEPDNLEAKVRVLDSRLTVLQGEVTQLARLVMHNFPKKEN